METNYCTEDGHFWDIEDLTQYALFKVKEMLELNYSNDEIIGFNDNKMWKKIANQIITALIQDI